MRKIAVFVSRRATPLLLLSALAVMVGCDSPPAAFEPNLVYVRNQWAETNADLRQAPMKQHARDVSEIVTAFFGTPDNPYVPSLSDTDMSSMFQLSKLQMAAGPVGSDEQGRPTGLYREHCAHCHGVTGNGRGPTAAFLNPYPRNYQRGLFKFKSTPATMPPTDDDLHRVLVKGIPGTSMPSFRLLPEDQRQALVQYVRYLALRGQFERNLILFVKTDLDLETSDDRLINLNLRQEEPATFADQLATVKELLGEMAAQWIDAEQSATEVPTPPENWGNPASVAEGRKLFFMTLTNCSKCHGDTALGDGQTTDYNEWDKELEPANPEALADYLSLGALEPRNARPRNLRQGVYRGGRRPIDMYWRMKNGIAGTPMPAAAQQLTADQLWHVIAYVRTLPYETISRPGRHDPPLMQLESPR